MHGNQRAVEDFGHFDAVQIGLHMRDVLVAQRRVHHDKVVVAGVGDDQVVHDAAVFVGEEAVARLAFLQGGIGLRAERFQLLAHVLAAQDHLAHVGDVKQRGLLAALLVLAHDAHGVLDRHFPAGEVDHLAAKLDVQVIKRGAFGCVGHPVQPLNY